MDTPSRLKYRPVLKTKYLRLDSGYSIVELAVVLAGLSVLASISLVGLDGKSGILGAVRLAEIDEAKALLNKAAADCLQKGRLGGDNKDLIDEEIINTPTFVSVARPRSIVPPGVLTGAFTILGSKRINKAKLQE